MFLALGLDFEERGCEGGGRVDCGEDEGSWCYNFDGVSVVDEFAAVAKRQW
ncbi:hypothetical protein RchiOBHm_Chr3g0481231 [Rosa chinensis]|uniref:Uncharacterized protein n=1 Tax=Rosa chinensis TaxID=74649 RepID=A0A2P6RDX0_ROSCH|nr:hypothetical protein RchiOBHm_Chr3g0481231 [Rosa chinensis]